MGSKMIGKTTVRPLFEKLLDEELEIQFEKNPKNSSSLSELQDSIINDMSLLLNTRVPIFFKNLANRCAPLSYGINLTDAIYAENVFEIKKMESKIKKITEQFEPRLTDVKVSVQKTGVDPSFLFINIDGIVVFENRRTQLSFPLVIKT
jgi:type VI secretion system lysozyme-like protein